MTNINELNYKQEIDAAFNNGYKVMVCIGVRNCKACTQTEKNILTFNPNKIKVFSVDYTTTDILQTGYEFSQLEEFPKTIIFDKNWDSKKYLEGIITKEILEEEDI